MLIGIELLDTIRQDETSDEKTLAKKCGYVAVQKSGAESVLSDFNPHQINYEKLFKLDEDLEALSVTIEDLNYD